MKPSVNSVSGSSFPLYSPDGRQTRIDFVSSHRQVDNVPSDSHSRKQNFEWWYNFTEWLRPKMKDQEQKLQEFNRYLIAHDYSAKTCMAYLFMLRKFFAYMEEKKVEEISIDIIEDYNYDFFVSGRYSRSYQQQFISGITLYLEFSENIKVNLKGLRNTRSQRK